MADEGEIIMLRAMLGALWAYTLRRDEADPEAAALTFTFQMPASMRAKAEQLGERGDAQAVRDAITHAEGFCAGVLREVRSHSKKE